MAGIRRALVIGLVLIARTTIKQAPSVGRLDEMLVWGITLHLHIDQYSFTQRSETCGNTLR